MFAWGQVSVTETGIVDMIGVSAFGPEIKDGEYHGSLSIEVKGENEDVNNYGKERQEDLTSLVFGCAPTV